MGTANITFIGGDQLRVDNRVFNAQDVAFFESDVGLTKVKQKLERSSHNFEIVIVANGPVSDSKFLVYESADYIKKVLRPQIPNLTSPDKITAIYMQNVSGRHIPLTAWMMLHRLGHMTFFNREEGRPHVDRPVGNSLAQGLQVMCDYDLETDYTIMEPDCKPAWAIAKLLLTMRSARQINMTSSTEIGSEVLAQYLLTGGVSLLRYEGWKERRDAIAAKFEKDTPGVLREFNEQYYTPPNWVINSPIRKVMHQIDKFIDHVANKYPVSQINDYLAAAEDLMNNTLAAYVETQKGRALIW